MCVCVCVCVCVHPHTHTYIHSNTQHHPYKHTHTHTHTHIRARTHIHARTDAIHTGGTNECGHKVGMKLPHLQLHSNPTCYVNKVYQFTDVSTISMYPLLSSGEHRVVLYGYSAHSSDITRNARITCETISYVYMYVRMCISMQQICMYVC